MWFGSVWSSSWAPTRLQLLLGSYEAPARFLPGAPPRIQPLVPLGPKQAAIQIPAAPPHHDKLLERCRAHGRAYHDSRECRVDSGKGGLSLTFEPKSHE